VDDNVDDTDDDVDDDDGEGESSESNKTPTKYCHRNGCCVTTSSNQQTG